MTALLLCSDPFAPTRSPRVVHHFAPVADAARDLGVPLALIDHDALVGGDVAASVRPVPEDLGPAWYRGWMVNSGQYAALVDALGSRGCTLLTDARAYQRAHELPGWYDSFRDRTPVSAWTGDTAAVDTWLTDAVTRLGSKAAIVKDFVKSRKHEWDTACHIPDLADAAGVRQVVSTFLELQGDDLNGGLVLRAFEDFAAPGGVAPQARVWWLDGRAVLTTPHPDTPDHLPEPDLTGLESSVARLGARFIATDLARRADGVWRVVEVGDGQVSDFPTGADITLLLDALCNGSGPVATR